MRYGTRLVVLCGALAWCSGMLLVQMNRGVLAHGRVAGVATSNVQPATKGTAAAKGGAGSPTDSIVPGDIREIGDDGDGGGGPAAGPLRIYVATTTPASATFPDGTLDNSMLAIQLRSLSSLPMSITSLTLTEGFAMFSTTSTSTLPTSTVVTGVSVWEVNHRHGATASLAGSQRRATVSMASDPVTIPAFGTKIVTVKADLPVNAPTRTNDYGVRLSLAAAADVVATGTSSIGGPFPLNGNLFSWVDGSSSIGQVSMNGYNATGYASAPATSTPANMLIVPGEENQVPLARVNMNEFGGYENVVLQNLELDIEGNVVDGDLRNFRLIAPGGVVVATAAQATNGHVAMAVSGGYVIPSSGNRTMSLVATPVAGTGHWFRFVIPSTHSVSIAGATSGALLNVNSAGGPGWPVTSPSSYWVIGAGAPQPAMQVAADASVGSTLTVIRGSWNTTVGQYLVTNLGSSNLTLSSIAFDILPGAQFSTTSLQFAQLYEATSTMSTTSGRYLGSVSPQNLSGHHVATLVNGVTLVPGRTLPVRIAAYVAPAARLGTFGSSAISPSGVQGSNGSGAVSGPDAAVAGQTVVVAEPTLAISSDLSQQPSRIILAGTATTSVHTLNFVPAGANETMNRLTLRFTGTIGGVANFGGQRNINIVRLYQGSTLLGTSNFYQFSTTTADVAFNFAQPVNLPLGNTTALTVKVDVANSGSGADATQFMVAVKSNSNADLDVRTAEAGLLQPSQIALASGNAASNWFLEHDASPVVLALAPVAHLQSLTDEIGRFEIRNYGQVPLTLSSLSFNVFAGGLQASTSSNDQVSNFRLYDDSGNYIAFPLTWYQLSSTNTAATSTFTSAGSIGTGWAENQTVPSMVGLNYGSRIFSLRADTRSITAAGGMATRTISVAINGQRGHVDGNSQSEPAWADGSVVYGYTPLGYSTARTGFTASDSYPVVAPIVSYN